MLVNPPVDDSWLMLHQHHRETAHMVAAEARVERRIVDMDGQPYGILINYLLFAALRRSWLVNEGCSVCLADDAILHIPIAGEFQNMQGIDNSSKPAELTWLAEKQRRKGSLVDSGLFCVNYSERLCLAQIVHSTLNAWAKYLGTVAGLDAMRVVEGDIAHNIQNS